MLKIEKGCILRVARASRQGRTHLVDSSVLLLPQLPVLRCILNTKQQQGVSWVAGPDGGGGRSEGFVLPGERRRGPTSAPLERSEESGTARHSLRAPAGSICGGAALPPSPASLRNRDLEAAARVYGQREGRRSGRREFLWEWRAIGGGGRRYRKGRPHVGARLS